MTDVEYLLKYPIGAEIRYVPNVNDVNVRARRDIGKQGTVIGYGNDWNKRTVTIHLPTSLKATKVWNTCWKHIKLVRKKNEQLLFNFMSEAT